MPEKLRRMFYKIAKTATKPGEKTPANVPPKRFFLYSVVQKITKFRRKTTITLHGCKGKNEISPKSDNYFTRV